MKSENESRIDNMLKYYQLIGSLKETVSRATSMDEALRNGIRLITELCKADTAIVWYTQEDGETVRPFYWIGALDFTSRFCRVGRGTVGEVIASAHTKRFLNYTTGTDSVTDAAFDGETVSSMVCVPFSSISRDLGCLQFAKTDGSVFSDEEADICEIFSSFLALEIDSDERFQKTAPPANVLLSTRGIKKAYQNGDVRTQVLKGVNVDIYEGEFLAILGESGCGKSTFLNIIGGMDQADEGEFTFLGRDLSRATQEELTEYRRNNIGFIFQSYNLMPNLNARQNLDLIGELVSDPMNSDEALELVGLSERKDNYPSQLSGGQQQRISIARALVKKPRLIFADEPTAALDYTTSIEVLSVMENIVKQGTTLVMVTHNEEITRMANRVIRMRNGRVYEVTVNRNPVHAEELVW